MAPCGRGARSRLTPSAMRSVISRSRSRSASCCRFTAARRSSRSSGMRADSPARGSDAEINEPVRFSRAAALLRDAGPDRQDPRHALRSRRRTPPIPCGPPAPLVPDRHRHRGSAGAVPRSPARHAPRRPPTGDARSSRHPPPATRIICCALRGSTPASARNGPHCPRFASARASRSRGVRCLLLPSRRYGQHVKMPIAASQLAIRGLQRPGGPAFLRQPSRRRWAGISLPQHENRPLRSDGNSRAAGVRRRRLLLRPLGSGALMAR